MDKLWYLQTMEYYSALKRNDATTTEAHVLQLLKPVLREPVLHNKRSHCSEKPAYRNEG